MNLKLPKITLIDDDPSADRHIEKAVKDAVPCVFSRHTNIDTFLTQPQKEPYQAILLDTYLLGGDLGKLERIIQSNPRTNVVVVTGKTTTLEELKFIVERKLTVDIVSKPREGSDYTQLSQTTFQTIANLKKQGKFQNSFPVAVIGGGNVAVPLVKELNRRGIETLWYSQYLSGKNELGVERYHDVITVDNLNETNLSFYDDSNLDSLFAQGPGIIILATSNFQTKGLPKCKDRRELKQWLYKIARHKNDKFREQFLRSGCDATLINITNPGETFSARDVLKYGIPPHKTVASCPDVPRLKKNWLGYLQDAQVCLFYEHTWPTFVPELTIMENGKSFLDNYPLSGEVLSSMFTGTLRSYGLEVMAAYRELEGRYPYTDAAETVAEDISRIQRFDNPVSLGYYYPQFKAHFLGPQAVVDYRDLGIHPPNVAGFKNLCDNEKYCQEFLKTAEEQRTLARSEI